MSLASINVRLTSELDLSLLLTTLSGNYLPRRNEVNIHGRVVS